MDETPTNASRYLKFIEAVLGGNREMRPLVDEAKFFIVLPGYGALTFDKYVQHMRRLLAVTRDFGYPAVIHDVVEQGGLVAVRYFMRFTVDVATTPRVVEYTGMDMVRFDAENKIVSIYVYYDLGSNQRQLFAQEPNV